MINGKENNGLYNGGRRGIGNILKDDLERNLDVYLVRWYSGYVFGRKEECYLGEDLWFFVFIYFFLVEIWKKVKINILKSWLW